MIRIVVFIAALLFAGPALAQGCGAANPNCVVPTAPAGDSTNRAASTAFVQSTVSSEATHFAAGGVSTGSANAQVIANTLPPVFSFTGDPTVSFVAGYSNTGAMTLNVASSGAKSVLKKTPTGLVSLATGDVIANQQYLATYDGTQYELQNPSTTASATVPATNLAAGGNGGVTGQLPNANLANSSTTVNSVTCTLGSSCTIANNNNVLNAQSTNYTIAAGDNGKTVYMTGGPYTVTLPAVTGFTSNAVVSVCNGNPNDASHHAVLMSGFPSQLYPRLYMQQCATVGIENGSWVTLSAPLPFRPSFIPSIYVDQSGSDTNDGLISNASGNAVADPQTCLTILQQEMEIYGGPPSCLLTSGGVFTGPTINYVKARGYGIVNVFGNGGTATIRTSSNVVWEMYDFAGYVIFANIQFDCAYAASHPCYGLFIHQQNGVDLGSGNSGATYPNYFNGGNTGDLGIWCDSQCKVNSAYTINFTGTWGTGVRLDLSSVASINSGITATGVTFAGSMLQVSGGSQLLMSGTMTLGGGTTVLRLLYVSNAAAIFPTLTVSGSLGGGQSYLVVNNGLYCNAGASALPGSAGSTTQSGSIGGNVPAASGATCTP